MREHASSAAIVLSLWLGWQMLLPPLADRLPAPLSLRLASTSPSALSRAAETAIADKRTEDAQTLAADALARSPFNVRALRILGQAEDAAGRKDHADQIITLAGNWSLRDDPAHAWLVDNRLRRGDYGSAFAHADTLARRRADLRPQLFQLFTTAAIQDPRALPHLTALLAADPPWREDYFEHLTRREDADPLIAALAVSLNSTRRPLRDDELQKFYLSWLSENRLSAILFVRQRLGRPAQAEGLVDGGFDGETAIEPFAWRFATSARFNIQVSPDDLRSDDNALRVEYRGRATGTMAQQLLTLAPGRYRLQAEARLEPPATTAGMSWAVACPGGVVRLVELAPPADARTWTSFSGEFTVPASGCDAQTLILQPKPFDSGPSVVVWHDRISIRPVGSAGSPPSREPAASTARDQG